MGFQVLSVDIGKGKGYKGEDPRWFISVWAFSTWGNLGVLVSFAGVSFSGTATGACSPGSGDGVATSCLFSTASGLAAMAMRNHFEGSFGVLLEECEWCFG